MMPGMITSVGTIAQCYGGNLIDPIIYVSIISASMLPSSGSHDIGLITRDL